MTARMQAAALRWRYAPWHNGLTFPGAPEAADPGVTPAAGEGAGPLGDGWTIWKTFDASFLKDRRPATASKGHALSFTLGLDRQWTPAFNAGLSLNAVRASQKTFYDAGRARTTTIAIGPYLSYALSDWLSLDAAAGYVHNREKRRRALPAAATGRARADGYMFSASLNASKWVDSWLLSGRAGLIATRDAWHARTESDGTFVAARTDKLTQGVVEAAVSLWLDPVMPYFNVAYARDLSSSDPAGGDRDDFTLKAGAAFYGSGRAEGLTVDFSGGVVLGRRRQRNITLSLGLRWNF